ncbi:MAG: hypothetical protein KAR57_00090 [Bacteroidales bacterium]|nr:hypothetical protein [Bacteroidales bacterium]
MEDIFDSLIYIIIAIVAFAISILGKKKKKQNQTSFKSQEGYNNSEKEEDSLLPNLEKLIREQVGIQDPYTYEEKYIEQEEVIQEEKPSDILDVVPPEMLDNKEDVPYSIEYEDTSEIFKDAIKDSDLTIEDNNEILENFNLRDAVIFSEIINRKEF